MRLSLPCMFACVGALFAAEIPTSITADTLVCKVESATTSRQYTFMANDAFLKGVPRQNQLSESDALEVALSYVKKYRGFKNADSVTSLECKMIYYNDVSVMFVAYIILDKDKQILGSEEAMILFGDKSYLIPSP